MKRLQVFETRLDSYKPYYPGQGTPSALRIAEITLYENLRADVHFYLLSLLDLAG